MNLFLLNIKSLPIISSHSILKLFNDPMNRIENQLNKIKNNSKVSSKKYEIDAKAVREFLEIVTDNQNTFFEDYTVAVLASQNGILTCGVGILDPKYLIALNSELFSECFQENLSILRIHCDLIQTSELKFKCSLIDIALIGPQFDKAKKTDLREIIFASNLAKTVFCCFEADHSEILMKKIPTASLIGKIQINIPLSLNYNRSDRDTRVFNVFKIENLNEF